MLHQFHFHQIHCPQFLGEFSWQDWQACLPQQNGGFHTEKTLPKMNWHCRNLELGEWLLMAKILLTRHYRQVTSTIPSFAVFSIICCTTCIPKFSISFHSDLMSFFWYLQGLNQGLPLLHVFFSNIIHGDLNWYHREAWNFWALSGADGQRASLLATWRVTGLGHSE